jgi:trehalose 6-phosphate synthase
LSRVVVVSNRVAPIKKGNSSVGGLAVAILAALKETGGLWFGWSGEVVETPREEPDIFPVGRLTYATIDLTHKDYDEYYNGYANGTLWPLFHYRLDLASFSRRNYEGYLRVNGLFARKLIPLLQDDDLIWVHDYHLFYMGEELRRRGLKNRIGFFLHTPFPATEVLVALPEHESLVRAMCAYDLLGFQTENDLRAFKDYIAFEAGGESRPDGTIQAFGRTFQAKVFAIGIDTEGIARDAVAAESTTTTQRLKESLLDRNLIIGVDRLDYSKGLVPRFLAFARLLEIYPTNRTRVTMLQIAPPSRSDVPEYLELRRALEETAGKINSRFAEFDWIPIRYLNKAFKQSTLIGFFRISGIGLVTPLRDGMNLVAKEYVAAQNPADPGVLVLSRFAGSARELDAALIVNPFDIDGVADALQTGLEMSQDERRERWAAMMAMLRRNDVTSWRKGFIGALQRSPCHALEVAP